MRPPTPIYQLISVVAVAGSKKNSKLTLAKANLSLIKAQTKPICQKIRAKNLILLALIFLCYGTNK